MDQTVMAKVTNISTNLTNPSRAAGLMMEVYEENVKLTDRVAQKYLIQKLVREKLGFKDVLSIERKQTMQRRRNNTKKDHGMISFLMRKKLIDAVEEVEEKRKEYRVAKKKLYEVVRYKSKSAREFRKL